MPSLAARAVATGVQLQQFVETQLRARQLSAPAAGRQERQLAAYLGALWHLSRQYRDQPFEFYFLADMLERAFDYPPLPYDWAAVLRQPYQPARYQLAPYHTPAYYASIGTYAYFESFIQRQIDQLLRLARLPSLPPFDAPVQLDGHRVHWLNLRIDTFLERGTSSLAEDLEAEAIPGWGLLAGMLHDGQFVE